MTVTSTHNASLSLTWHEQTEHLSLSSTQICPLCLTLLSWIQSPVQLWPWGQRQSYPPSRLKHTVSLAHVLRPVRHSSMSEESDGGSFVKTLKRAVSCAWVRVRLPYLYTTPRWRWTPRCHGNRHDTRSDTSQVSSRRWRVRRTAPNPPSIRRYLNTPKTHCEITYILNEEDNPIMHCAHSKKKSRRVRHAIHF